MWKFLFDPEESGDVGGDGTGDSAEGSETGDDGAGEVKHPWDVITPFLDGDGNLIVKKDGKEVAMGPAAVVAEIQKGQTASKRLEDATSARDEAEGAIQYAHDISAALEGDEAAYFRLAESRGFTQQEAQAMLDEEGQVDEEPVEPKIQYVEREQSQAERDTQKWAHQERMKQVKSGIFSDIDVGLDKDPRFATIMKGGGKRAAKVQTLAQRAVTRMVVSTGQEFDEALLSAALDEVADDVDVFGGETPPPPGVGAAYSGAPLLTPPPETPTKRPSHDDPGYDRWVGEQLGAIERESLAKG